MDIRVSRLYVILRNPDNHGSVLLLHWSQNSDCLLSSPHGRKLKDVREPLEPTFLSCSIDCVNSNFFTFLSSVLYFPLGIYTLCCISDSRYCYLTWLASNRLLLFLLHALESRGHFGSSDDNEGNSTCIMPACAWLGTSFLNKCRCWTLWKLTRWKCLL